MSRPPTLTKALGFEILTLSEGKAKQYFNVFGSGRVVMLVKRCFILGIDKKMVQSIILQIGRMFPCGLLRRMLFQL
eukprot:797880-Pelagomonas_calceolata.AAC.1